MIIIPANNTNPQEKMIMRRVFEFLKSVDFSCVLSISDIMVLSILFKVVSVTRGLSSAMLLCAFALYSWAKICPLLKLRTALKCLMASM